MKTPALAIGEVIASRLELLSQDRRLFPDPWLAAELEALETATETLEAASLPDETLRGYRAVLDCCVRSRFFMDWLHTRRLLEGADGLDPWCEAYARLESRIQQAAERVMEALRDCENADLAHQAERYCANMAFRKHLAHQLSEGLSGTRELLRLDLEERGESLNASPSPRVAALPELEPEAIDDEGGAAALFVLWRAVRFLRHKLLLSAVELSHESGPWAECVEDHLSLNTAAQAVAGELLAEAAALAAPEGPAALRDVWQAAEDTRCRAAAQITAALAELRREREIWGGFSAVLGEAGTIASRLRSIGAHARQAHADLEVLEDCLRPAVEARLGDADALLEDLESMGSGPVTRGELPRLLQAVSPDVVGHDLVPTSEMGANLAAFGNCSAEELAEWLDAVLMRGWTLPPPLDHSEQIALEIFRHLASRDLTRACEYVERSLRLAPGPGVLRESVGLMFCGALHRAAAEGGVLPPWHQWLELASRVARRELAEGYSTPSRAALLAELMGLCLRAAPNNDFMARQMDRALGELETSLRESIPPGASRHTEYFLAHLPLELEDYVAGKPDAPLQAMLIRRVEELAALVAPTEPPSLWAIN